MASEVGIHLSVIYNFPKTYVAYFILQQLEAECQVPKSSSRDFTFSSVAYVAAIFKIAF